MVPHIKVEEKLHELAGVDRANVRRHRRARREERRTPRRAAHARRRQTQACARKTRGLRSAESVEAAARPVLPRGRASRLGTGKLDLRKVREMALKQSASGAVDVKA